MHIFLTIVGFVIGALAFVVAPVSEPAAVFFAMFGAFLVGWFGVGELIDRLIRRNK